MSVAYFAFAEINFKILIMILLSALPLELYLEGKESDNSKVSWPVLCICY